MSEVRISKIKLRRGLNEQRKHVIFDQGEVIYTIDTKRLFVGTGVLSGGEATANKIHSPTTNKSTLSSVVAERGDLVSVNSMFYQLTGFDYDNIDNWAYVGLKTNNEFKFDNNNLTLNISAIELSATNIKNDTIGSGLILSGGKLQSDFNTKSIEISSNKLSLKAGGIDEREINSTSFGDGISGGSGGKIALKIRNGLKFDTGELQSDFNTKSIEISSNKLSLKAGGIDEREINSTSFGDGISGGSGGKIALKISGEYLYFDNGVLSLTSTPQPITVDDDTLVMDGGLIYVSPNGITEFQIAAASFGNGITGGNGVKIQLDVDPNVFYFNAENQLSYTNAVNISSFDPYSINGTFVGKQSGLSSFEADSSVFVGVSAGFNSPKAFDSVFIGNRSGFNLGESLEETITSNSVFIGNESGYLATDSYGTVMIGDNAGYSSNISEESVFIGTSSGANSTSCNFSNFVGLESGLGSTGEYNNAIGHKAGSNTTGNHNQFIGAGSTTLSSDISGCLMVGTSATAIENNTIALGSTAVQFLTAVTTTASGISLVIRLNGTDFTIPLNVRD